MVKLKIGRRGSKCGRKWSTKCNLLALVVLQPEKSRHTPNCTFNVPAVHVITLSGIFIEQYEAKRDVRRIFEGSKGYFRRARRVNGENGVDQGNLIVYCSTSLIIALTYARGHTFEIAITDLIRMHWDNQSSSRDARCHKSGLWKLHIRL